VQVTLGGTPEPVPSAGEGEQLDLARCRRHRALAERCCHSDCRWYHGNWALLNSLGVVTTSAVHAREWSALLGRVLRSCVDAPRVLLSGATDDALLRMLVAARGEREMTVTALDRCATPVEAMKRYAAAQGLALRPVCSDILRYSPDDTFDLILTHAFLGNFDAAGRRRLVSHWFGLLDSGGSVVTMQRVRAPDSPPLVTFSPDQAARFVQGALDAARRAGAESPEDIAWVELAARTFAERFVSHAIASRAELEGLFVDAGFRLEHLEYRALATRGRLAGPSVPSGGEYALVIAGRPQP
jgi:hypothetical protein